MKDIPMFTTEYGVASLMLHEVPYRQEAYIRVHDVQPGHLEDLIRECMGFCRAVGAERVYWSAGDSEGELYAAVYEMQGTAWVDSEKLESLFPVTRETVIQFRQLLNEKMAGVDNAATITASDEFNIMNNIVFNSKLHHFCTNTFWLVLYDFIPIDFFYNNITHNTPPCINSFLNYITPS